MNHHKQKIRTVNNATVTHSVPHKSALFQFQLPGRHAGVAGGSLLEVQTNASLFCMEPQQALNSSGLPIKGVEVCPTWAGGDGKTQYPQGQLDGGWVMLNFTTSDASTVDVDISPLNGTAPTAVRYAWGIVDCCDYTDPNLYVTHGWYGQIKGQSVEVAADKRLKYGRTLTYSLSSSPQPVSPSARL